MRQAPWLSLWRGDVTPDPIFSDERPDHLESELEAASISRERMGSGEKLYSAAHRAKRLKGTRWHKLSLEAFERDGWACVYCDAPSDDLHCDHLVPLARGGSNAAFNLATACASCNLSKGSKLLSEWEPCP